MKLQCKTSSSTNVTTYVGYVNFSLPAFNLLLQFIKAGFLFDILHHFRNLVVGKLLLQLSVGFLGYPALLQKCKQILKN